MTAVYHCLSPRACAPREDERILCSMLFFSKKQKQAADSMAQYNTQVLQCVDEFEKAVRNYVASGDRQALAGAFQLVHAAEGRADDIRREIEVLMYTKALFPESRGDILGLLEAMDKVPNQAEAAVRMILNQHIPLPADLAPGILSIIEASCRCIGALIDAVDSLFSNFIQATSYVGKVDEIESEVDRLEEDLIDRIFSGDARLIRIESKSAVLSDLSYGEERYKVPPSNYCLLPTTL